jgi:hypothetical protein
MLWSFLTYPDSVVFLRAPYTRETIETAFKLVGAADLIPQVKAFDVRKRTSSNKTRPGLDPLWKPYQEFEKLLNSAPAVWRANQPPPALYAYLEKEFKGATFASASVAYTKSDDSANSIRSDVQVDSG